MNKIMQTLSATMLSAGLLIAGSQSAMASTTPTVVETAPPAPILNPDCTVTDPNPDDVWSYSENIDELGLNNLVDAYVPEGYVIGATGQRYWSSVSGFFDLQCPTTPAPQPEPEPQPEPQPEPEPEPEPQPEPEPEPIEEPAPIEEPVVVTPPADVTPEVEETVTPQLLAETGPLVEQDRENLISIYVGIGLVLLGVLLFAGTEYFRRRRNDSQ